MLWFSVREKQAGRHMDSRERMLEQPHTSLEGKGEGDCLPGGDQGGSRWLASFGSGKETLPCDNRCCAAQAWKNGVLS